MIKSTDYYLRYKQDGSIHNNFVDCKTLKSLEKEIKKFIDNKVTFEVWVRFNFRDDHRYAQAFMNNYTSFEIWYYDAETDCSSTYNLRKNMYYKRLRRYERRLSKLMLTYGLKKG